VSGENVVFLRSADRAAGEDAAVVAALEPEFAGGGVGGAELPGFGLLVGVELAGGGCPRLRKLL